jgi:hypothetical protein
MRIFGKPAAEYFSIAKGLTILVAIVGCTRLALSLAGVPNPATRWISMSVVMWAGVLYLAIRVQKSGFGSYRHLLPVVAIPNLATQLVSFAAIVIGILTGVDNVFTAPEAAFGGDGRNWLHAFSHPLVGGTVGSIVYWLFCCLFLLIVRTVSRQGKPAAV